MSEKPKKREAPENASEGAAPGGSGDESKAKKRRDDAEAVDERLYCGACGGIDPVVRLSSKLSLLPKRSTDGAYVVDVRKLKTRNLVDGETKLIKREKGVEKQVRMLCPRCKLVAAYRPNEDFSKCSHIYLIAQGALTDVPPPEAAAAEGAEEDLELPPAELIARERAVREVSERERQMDENESVACNTHGKWRAKKFMVKNSTGGWVCRSGMACMINTTRK
eukprot:tig00020604_g11857.t1